MFVFIRFTLAILMCNIGFSHGDNAARIRSETGYMERDLISTDDDVDLSGLTNTALSANYIEKTGALSSAVVCVNEMDGFDKPRALPFYSGRGDGYDTKLECSAKCQAQGYLVSGRADHGQCWCAEELGYENSAVSDPILYNQYGINTACDCTNVDTADVGHDLVCVTVINVQAEFVGCFSDDVPRSLPTFVDNGLSYFQCALECYAKHYQFFGRQYDKECWCGNGITHAVYGQLADTACNCDGNDIGFFKQCIYKIPDEKYTPNHIYLGCYADENEDRALPNRLEDGDGSIEKCSEECNDNFYDLFGVQFDMECWCGRTNVDDPYKHGYSTGCDCDSLTNIGMNLFCLFAIAKPEPTAEPTSIPSVSSSPSVFLSDVPSSTPSIAKSSVPSSVPSRTPSSTPSAVPTFPPTTLSPTPP